MGNASTAPTVEELAALGARAQAMLGPAMRTGMSPVFLMAHEQVYLHATMLTVILARDYDTKLPKGVEIKPAPFEAEELNDWRSRLCMGLGPKRGGSSQDEVRRSLWMAVDCLHAMVKYGDDHKDDAELVVPDGPKLVGPA